MKQKLLSVLMAVVISIGFITNVTAAETDKALETAILTVKERVTIPSAYTKFSYSKNANYGQTRYYLTWRDKNSQDNLTVEISGNVVTSYYHYKENDSNENEASFADLSKANLIKKAYENIEMLNPTVYERIYIDEDTYSTSLKSLDARFNIYRTENGIKVLGDNGYITVNKNTGELMSYSISWLRGLNDLLVNDGIISEKDAETAYGKEIGLMPVYRVLYDYSNKTKSTALQYVPKTNDKINALTGKVSDFSHNYGYDQYDEEYEDDIAMEEEPLSAEELEKIKLDKGLITSKEALQILIDDPYIRVNKDYKINSESLVFDHFDEEYAVWNINLKSGKNIYSYAKLDAKTGTILYFDDGNYDSSTTNGKLNESRANSNAEKALKNYLGDKFSEYVLDEKETKLTSNYGAQAITTGKQYVYKRYKNDILVENNNVHITISPDGYIRRFTYTYDDVNFRDPSKMISEQTALKKLFAAQKLDLEYEINITDKTFKKSVQPSYSMKYFYMNALTGRLVNYDNTAKAVKTTGYSDISKHSIKKIATTLSENGIRLDAVGGKLLPDEPISEKDFITLVNKIHSDWDTFYYGYSRRLYEKPESLKPTISRQDAVKCLIDAVGGSSIAQLKSAFIMPYKDVPATSSYYGYFAMAHAYGITSANSKGEVRPTATITRGEALKMIYNYLMS